MILARVLHDWDDASALRLLRTRTRRALPPEGRVFVIEMALPEDRTAGGLCDLHLLAVTGGRERTASEYAALLGSRRVRPWRPASDCRACPQSSWVFGNERVCREPSHG